MPKTVRQSIGKYKQGNTFLSRKCFEKREQSAKFSKSTRRQDHNLETHFWEKTSCRHEFVAFLRPTVSYTSYSSQKSDILKLLEYRICITDGLSNQGEIAHAEYGFFSIRNTVIHEATKQTLIAVPDSLRTMLLKVINYYYSLLPAQQRSHTNKKSHWNTESCYTTRDFGPCNKLQGKWAWRNERNMLMDPSFSPAMQKQQTME